MIKMTAATSTVITMPDRFFNLFGTGIDLPNRGIFIDSLFAVSGSGKRTKGLPCYSTTFVGNTRAYAYQKNEFDINEFWHFVSVRQGESIYMYPKNEDISYKLGDGLRLDNKTLGLLCSIASLKRSAKQATVAADHEAAAMFKAKLDALLLTIFEISDHLLQIERDESNKAALIAFQNVVRSYTAQ